MNYLDDYPYAATCIENTGKEEHETHDELICTGSIHQPVLQIKKAKEQLISDNLDIHDLVRKELGMSVKTMVVE